MESSCILQCRFSTLSLLALPSSTSYSYSFLRSHGRNGGARRKSSVHINSFCSAKFLCKDNCEERMSLILDVPVSRFISSAIEGGRDVSMTDGGGQEKKFQSRTPANVFISLLNELGLLWLVFIRTLFGFPPKEKKAMEAALESLKKQLEEREDAIVSMEKSFKMKLRYEQEESRRHVGEAKEARESLENQLELAKDSLEYSKEKLEKEKKLVEDLVHQVASLSDNLTTAVRAKKELEGLMNEKLEVVKSLQENIDDLNLQKNEREKNIEILRSSLSANDLELKNTRILCSDLESNMSQIQSEFAEASESLQRKLSKSEQNTSELVMELASTKEHLEKTKDEERERVASLNRENKALEMQSLKDKDARRSLENTLDEATKSLDEMNQKALMLSRELEKATSRVYALEEERSVLCKTVEDQKKAAQEAHENLEDARGVMMRIGEEKGSWERRAKKLEEDLQLAKGEILRLRIKARSGRSRLNNRLSQNTEADSSAAIHAKRNGGT